MTQRLIIEIILTQACNRACSYCAGKEAKIDCATQDHGAYSKPINAFGDYELSAGVINFPALKKWLLFQKEQMTEFDIQIVLTGGEPTLVRTLPELIEWIAASGFKPPILYTNGRNISDLAAVENVKGKVKVCLTKHKEPYTKYDMALPRPPSFEEALGFLGDAQIPHLVKVLIGEKDENPEVPQGWIVEGIKRVYSPRLEEFLRQRKEYPSEMGTSSPYKWRWDGYGGRIDRRRTKFVPTIIMTALPTGNVFNCHLFKQVPISAIYELVPIKQMPVQLAFCNYQKQMPFPMPTHKEYLSQFEGTETLCELQHYVNLFENAAQGG
jgi:organic radical activating enzyme